MATTYDDIAGWLAEGRKKENISHMLVVCDNFSYEDYPVYVPKSKQVQKVYAEYDGRNMQCVMEVYSYHRNLEEQLNEHRAFHFD